MSSLLKKITLLLILCVATTAAAQVIFMPASGDTTVVISSNSTHYLRSHTNILSSYPPGTSSITIKSADGRPFTLAGDYSIGLAHCLTIFDGETTHHPIQGFYNDDGSLKIYCPSGAVTLHFARTPSGRRSGFLFTICFPDVYNVHADSTNSTYTHIAWNSGGYNRYYFDYFQSNDPSRSTQHITLNNNTYHYNPQALAPGTEYTYHIRPRYGYYSNYTYDTSDYCNAPPHKFRTPKVANCNTCGHNRDCINFADFYAEQVICYKGNFAKPDSAICVSPSQHNKITNTADLDPRTANHLHTIPPGDTAAVRLGDFGTTNDELKRGESILYELHIDTNDYDLFVLRYATVLSLLNTRINKDKPRFSIRLFDENCLPIQPLCYCRELYDDGNLVNWDTAYYTYGGVTSPYIWHDWTSMGIDVAPYHGKTIYLQLSTSDGNANGNAYAYFTLHCARKQIDHLQQCSDNIANTFYAPEGFQYRWFNALNPDSTLSTTNALQVSDSGLYQCWVAPLECFDQSCGYTISALAAPRFPHADFDSIITTSSCSFNVRFINRSFIADALGNPLWTNEDCETAFWDFGNGQTSTDYNATAVYTAAGTYNVTLIVGIAGGQCTDTITKQIHLQWAHQTPHLMGDSIFCPAPNQLNMTMLNTTSCRWEYFYEGETWPDNSTSIMLDDITAQTIHCYVTDSNYCEYHFQIPITILPTYNDTISRTICQAQLDSTWTWRGHTFQYFNTSGLYTYYETTARGCDSTVTLRLTVHPSYNVYPSYTFCDYTTSYPYPPDWSSPLVVYDTLGPHTYIFHNNVTGCDSIVHMTLRKHIVMHDTLRADICRGYAFDTLDFHYSAAQTAATGLLTQTHTATETIRDYDQVQQCDSTMTLLLTVNPQTQSIHERTVQENGLPFLYNGIYFYNDVDTVMHRTNRYGCDSTIHLILHVNHNTVTNLYHTICDDQLPYAWDGLTFTEAGTLHRSLSRDNGADSIIYHHLTVHPTYHNDTTVAICQGDAFSFCGTSHNTPGTYTYPLTSMHQCDSIETLVLAVNPIYTTTTRDTTCSSDNYTFNGQQLTASGLYTETLTSSQGCDSTVNLTLTVNPVTEGYVHDSVRQNDLPHTFLGTPFSDEVNDRLFHLTNHYGCDSTVHYWLTIHWNVNKTVRDTICADQLPYTWDGTLFNANDYNGTGRQTIEKTVTLANATGADSVVTRLLTVNPVYNQAYSHSMCNNTTFSFADSTFAALPSGTASYTFNLTTTAGCDSTVVLNLTVVDTTWSTAAETIVENQLPHTFNGVTYTAALLNSLTAPASMTINDTIVIANVAGCDSTIYHTLTIIPNVSTQVDSTICRSELPLTWNGVTFTEADYDFTTAQNLWPPIYQSMKTATLTTGGGSDSLVRMTLHVNPTYDHHFQDTICDNGSISFADTLFGTLSEGSYTFPFLFATTMGCDSAATLHLTVNPTFSHSFADTTCSNAPFLFADTAFLYLPAGLTTIDFLFHSVAQCDSAVSLHLFTIDTSWSVIYDTIVENQLPYTFNGVTYTDGLLDDAATPIAANTVNILDTIVIANAEGCDSTLYYHLAIHRNQRTTVYDTVCESQLPFTWDGSTFDTVHITNLQPRTLSLTDTLTNSDGADSIVMRMLTVNPTYDHHRYDTICDNATLTYADSTYALAGSYTHLFASAALCDSSVTIHLALNPTHATSFADTTCSNLVYRYGDSILATTIGTTPWTFLHHNSYRCDSVVTLSLTVNAITDSLYYDTIVENQLPYTFNGVTYTAAHLADSAAATASWANTSLILDTIVIANAKGCDSTLFYHLTVHRNQRTDIDSTICENDIPFTWQGALFDTTAVPTTTPVVLTMTRSVTYTAQQGEDSVVVMHLTVNPNTRSSLFDTIVQNQLSYSWNSVTFDTALSASSEALLTIERSATLVNADGCDSVADMQLAVWLNRTAATDSALCQNTFPLVWNNTIFDSTDFDFVTPLFSATKQAMLLTTHGADSLLTMNVTLMPNTFAAQSDTIFERQLPYLFNGYSFDSAMFADTNSIAIVSGDTVTTVRFSSLDSTVVIANSHGCDSIISYSLSVIWNVHSTADSTVCSETLPLQWNARTFTQDIVDASPAEGRWRLATLYDTLPAASGADSIVAMRLHVMPSYANQFFDTVCENNTFVWYDDTLTISGIYDRHFVTVDGCDSAEYLHFANYPNYDLTYYDTICDYSGVMRMGVEYIGASHMQTIHTCDSNEVYHLWAYPVSYASFNDTISDHQLPYAFNGHLFSDTTDAQLQLILTNQYGCDSIVNFTLTVMPTLRLSVDSTICESLLPLDWDGTLFTDDILTTVDSAAPATSPWAKPVKTATLIDTLHTRFGADSIVTRNLIVNPEYLIPYIDTTCNGAPYPFGDSLYTLSGIYTHSYTTVGHCDSIETLQLQVNAMSYATVFDTIVENQLPYTFGGVTFTTTQTIVDSTITILNTAACDSVITYSLFVYPNHHYQRDTSLCDNQLPFNWNGLTFTLPQGYDPNVTSLLVDSTVVTLADATDSITRYYVNLRRSHDRTETYTVCDTLRWIDGNTYTQNTSSPIVTSVNAEGCDSIIRLSLTVRHSSASTDVHDVCDSLRWIDGVTYTQSNTEALYTTLNTQGCDSTITLDLTVRHSTASTDSQTACQTFTWIDGITYTQSNAEALFTMPNAQGCDSTIALDLTVLQPPAVKLDWEYDCDTRIYTLTATTEAPFFEWSSFPDDPALTGHLHDRSIQVSPRTHELYMLFVDHNDFPTCPNTDSAYLSPLLKPHANIEYTPEFLTLDQLHLSAINRSTNELDHRWYVNGVDHGTDTRISYMANPSTDDSVVLFLVANNGLCHDSARAVIPFRKATIWTPNTFTPDESTNSTFFVRFMGITDYSIDLYTRGGALVWHSDDMNDEWDGTYKGQPCPQGAYVWIIHYRDVTAPRNLLSKKGTVTLLR